MGDGDMIVFPLASTRCQGNQKAMRCQIKSIRGDFTLVEEEARGQGFPRASFDPRASFYFGQITIQLKGST
jgi:hypothetical protein